MNVPWLVVLLSACFEGREGQLILSEGAAPTISGGRTTAAAPPEAPPLEGSREICATKGKGTLETALVSGEDASSFALLDGTPAGDRTELDASVPKKGCVDVRFNLASGLAPGRYSAQLLLDTNKKDDIETTIEGIVYNSPGFGDALVHVGPLTGAPVSRSVSLDNPSPYEAIIDSVTVEFDGDPAGITGAVSGIALGDSLASGAVATFDLSITAPSGSEGAGWLKIAGVYLGARGEIETVSWLHFTYGDQAPEDCATPGDEDGDGDADCDDSDCIGDPACATGTLPDEDCAAAGDEDGDGLEGCDDLDCACTASCFSGWAESSYNLLWEPSFEAFIGMPFSAGPPTQQQQWAGDASFVGPFFLVGAPPPPGGDTVVVQYNATESDPLAPAGPGDEAELWQLVDVTSLRGQTVCGAASFARADVGDPEADTAFLVRMRVYDGIDSDFPEVLAASAGTCVLPDCVEIEEVVPPGPWTPLAVPIEVPAGTGFATLAFQMSAVENVTNDTTSPEFDGHWGNDAFVFALPETEPITITETGTTDVCDVYAPCPDQADCESCCYEMFDGPPGCLDCCP